MKQVLERYVSYLQLLDKSESTIKNYLSTARQFMKTEEINSKEEFLQLDMNWWLAHLQKEKNSSISSATINKKKNQMSSFYEFLIISEGAKVQNFCKNLPAINTNSQSEFKEKVLNNEQIKNILDSANHLPMLRRSGLMNLRDKTIINLFFDCGLRIEEMSKIKLQDIVFSENKLYIRGKGHQGNVSRFNYFNDTTAEMIKELVSYDTEREFLFVQLSNGKQLGTQAIRNMWNMVLKMANVSEEYTPHNVRHSVGSKLITDGVHVELVAQYLGHESKNTTEKYYVKATNKIEEIGKLNNVWFS